MRIGFLGGDARMRVCAEGAARAHHTVISLASFGVGVRAPDASALIKAAELIVLPSPASRDGSRISGTDILFSDLALAEGQAVFGGFIPPAWRRTDLKVHDCAESESFLLKNAALTADGAVATALSASGRAFYGLSVGVIGYGRIARLLSRRLSGFGVPITVYARRSEARADAALSGYSVQPLTEDTVFGESLLFNTVPTAVFSGTRGRGTLFAYDLGGGFPTELPLADGGALPVVSMRGVPGVFAPTAAGEIILEELLAFLNGKGATSF